MIGNFRVEHIRKGEVIRSFECDNPVGELVRIRRERGEQVYHWAPGSELGVTTFGNQPLGDLEQAVVFTFPEPINLKSPDDELRIEFTEFMRACGETICGLCGKTYFDHPYSDAHRDYLDRPFIKQLCDGRLVKL